MGFVAHHLISFTREALRGEHNASFYAAKAAEARGCATALVGGGPAQAGAGARGGVALESQAAPSDAMQQGSCATPCLRRKSRASALGRWLASLYTPRLTHFILTEGDGQSAGFRMKCRPGNRVAMAGRILRGDEPRGALSGHVLSETAGAGSPA